MGKQQDIMSWLKIFIVLLPIQAHLANGFSWNSWQKAESDKYEVTNSATVGDSLPQLLRSRPRMPNSYKMALNELQELEFKPVCHKTAARLLVHNCQLVEDMNESTFHTESSPETRDFVDAYAASLALCDLERGGFQIPTECDKFREPALNQLSRQNMGRLHLSTKEVKICLHAFGSSSSAWSTWVSYRHKAFAFCEAARIDNEKDQQILLAQRLVDIMGRYANDVEEQFKQHMTDLESRTEATVGRINELSPQVDYLKNSLESWQKSFFGQLSRTVQETTDVVNSGAEHAANLEQMLQVILKGALEGQAELAFAYERSIQLANERAESAMNTAVKAIELVTESAAQLGSQLELSRLQAAELVSRQNDLEQGIQRLMNMTEGLTISYDDHADRLHEARNLTEDILDSLEETAASATYVGSSVLKQSSTSSWWPYIWCPAASLVLGSYGLPPSATRNLALVALGEVAGFTLSSIQSIYHEYSLSSAIKLSTLLYTWGDSSAAPSSVTCSNLTDNTEQL